MIGAGTISSVSVSQRLALGLIDYVTQSLHLIFNRPHLEVNSSRPSEYFSFWHLKFYQFPL
jgi:hypothetical protein